MEISISFTGGREEKKEEEVVMTTCRTSMPPLQPKYCYSGKNQQMDYITTIYRSKTNSLSVLMSTCYG